MVTLNKADILVVDESLDFRHDGSRLSWQPLYHHVNSSKHDVWALHQSGGVNEKEEI